MQYSANSLKASNAYAKLQTASQWLLERLDHLSEASTVLDSVAVGGDGHFMATLDDETVLFYHNGHITYSSMGIDAEVASLDEELVDDLIDRVDNALVNATNLTSAMYDSCASMVNGSFDIAYLTNKYGTSTASGAVASFLDSVALNAGQCDPLSLFSVVSSYVNSLSQVSQDGDGVIHSNDTDWRVKSIAFGVWDIAASVLNVVAGFLPLVAGWGGMIVSAAWSVVSGLLTGSYANLPSAEAKVVQSSRNRRFAVPWLRYVDEPIFGSVTNISKRGDNRFTLATHLRPVLLKLLNSAEIVQISCPSLDIMLWRTGENRFSCEVYLLLVDPAQDITSEGKRIPGMLYIDGLQPASSFSKWIESPSASAAEDYYRGSSSYPILGQLDSLETVDDATLAKSVMKSLAIASSYIYSTARSTLPFPAEWDGRAFHANVTNSVTWQFFTTAGFNVRVPQVAASWSEIVNQWLGYGSDSDADRPTAVLNALASVISATGMDVLSAGGLNCLSTLSFVTIPSLGSRNTCFLNLLFTAFLRLSGVDDINTAEWYDPWLYPNVSFSELTRTEQEGELPSTILTVSCDRSAPAVVPPSFAYQSGYRLIGQVLLVAGAALAAVSLGKFAVKRYVLKRTAVRAADSYAKQQAYLANPTAENAQAYVKAYRKEVRLSSACSGFFTSSAAPQSGRQGSGNVLDSVSGAVSTITQLLNPKTVSSSGLIVL